MAKRPVHTPKALKARPTPASGTPHDLVDRSKVKRPARTERLEMLTLLVLTLGCLVPFLGKPFHVDDPLFVWAGRHILAHPLDFYGFKVNWSGQVESMADVALNPPFAAYYLAAFGGLLGWSEVALHSAFLLPAVATVLGTYCLAKHFCSRPLAAALIAVCSPVFALSATSVMCDTMMLGFWVWAVYFWVVGLERQSQTRLAIAAVLISLSAATKYFGICLIPLLLAYGALKLRRPGWYLAWLGLPVLVLVLYQVWTRHLYGMGLLFHAATYATHLRVGGALPAKLLAGLTFTGGCLIFVLFASPLLWSKRGLAFGAATVLIASLLLPTLKQAGEFPLTGEHGTKWLYVIQLSLFAAGGVAVLVLAGADLLRHRNAASALLFLWVSGVFLFASVMNWTVSGRNILPMLPAAACLVVRRLEAAPGGDVRKLLQRLAVPAGLSLLLSLLATRADCLQATSARETARSLQREFRSGSHTIWFEGHWGFQYYMEQLDARPLDRTALALAKNDVVVLPLNNSYLFVLPDNLASEESIREVPTCRWLAVMNEDCGAGYYSDGWGPLPFAFGRVPPDSYVVLRAR